MAANLKEAARQLTEEIGEWEADAEAATRRFEALEETLEERERELDEAIAELEKEVDTFVSKVMQETATLAGSLQEADQAMTRAERTAVAAGEATAGAVAQSEAQVRALAERLSELPGEVEAVVEGALETPASQLAEQARALMGAFEQALDGTAGNVDAFAASVAELQEAIPNAADGMGAAIKTQTDHVGAAFVQWTSRLFEVVDLVDKEAYDAVVDNAGEVVAHALEQAREELDAGVERAVAGVSALDERIETVADALAEAAKEDVAEGLREPVKTELADLSSAIEESTKWLKEVQKWLADYKFVS